MFKKNIIPITIFLSAFFCKKKKQRWGKVEVACRTSQGNEMRLMQNRVHRRCKKRAGRSEKRWLEEEHTANTTPMHCMELEKWEGCCKIRAPKGSEGGVAVGDGKAEAGRRRHSAKQTESAAWRGGDSLAWKMQFIMQNEKQTTRRGSGGHSRQRSWRHCYRVGRTDRQAGRQTERHTRGRQTKRAIIEPTITATGGYKHNSIFI